MPLPLGIPSEPKVEHSAVYRQVWQKH